MIRLALGFLDDAARGRGRGGGDVRLISLRLRQWRCYEDCFIEFPDGLDRCPRANGAGKSTIAEAIGWALFGKLRQPR